MTYLLKLQHGTADVNRSQTLGGETGSESLPFRCDGCDEGCHRKSDPNQKCLTGFEGTQGTRLSPKIWSRSHLNHFSDPGFKRF